MMISCAEAAGYMLREPCHRASLILISWTHLALALDLTRTRAPQPATELIPLLPRLRVLARSSPEDKLTLVSLLKKQGEVRSG